MMGYNSFNLMPTSSKDFTAANEEEEGEIEAMAAGVTLDLEQRKLRLELSQTAIALTDRFRSRERRRSTLGVIAVPEHLREQQKSYLEFVENKRRPTLAAVPVEKHEEESGGKKPQLTESTGDLPWKEKSEKSEKHLQRTRSSTPPLLGDRRISSPKRRDSQHYSLTARRHQKAKLSRLAEGRKSSIRPRHSHAHDSPEEKEEVSILDKWRERCQVLRLIIKFCMSLTDYASDAGLLDRFLFSVAPRKVQLTDEVEGKTIVHKWDPKQFLSSKNRTFTASKRALKVFRKRPEERTDRDLRIIFNITRGIPTFRKYSEEMQLNMCRIASYTTCNTRRVVLRQGHIAYSIYFLLTGSVNVVMDKDDQSVFNRAEVILLKKGACFGEMAVLEEQRRSATVVCAEDCEFLLIDRDDFMKYGLADQLDAEFAARFKFFRKCPYFESWSDESLQSLSCSSRTEDFLYGKTIVAGTDKKDFLWFVMKGSCSVVRQLDLRHPPIPGMSADSFLGITESKKQATSEMAKTWTTKWLKGNKDKKLNDIMSVDISQTDELQDKIDAYVKEVDKVADIDKHAFTGAEEDDKPKQSVAEYIFVQCDELREGELFGAESLHNDSDSDHRGFHLLSKKCVMIQLNRATFMDMTDKVTLTKLKMMVVDYPDDYTLYGGYLSHMCWDQCKHNIIEEAVVDKINRKIYTSNGRDNSFRVNSVREYIKSKLKAGNVYGNMLSEEEAAKQGRKIKSALMSHRSMCTAKKAKTSLEVEEIFQLEKGKQLQGKQAPEKKANKEYTREYMSINTNCCAVPVANERANSSRPWYKANAYELKLRRATGYNFEVMRRKNKKRQNSLLPYLW